MTLFRHLAFATAIAAAAAASLAQDRGSVPPGESRDESRPAEGAIKGGSIERDVGTSPAPRRDIARCKQLTGDLREQCLRDLGASAGGTAPPKPAPPSPARRDPLAEPPPQDPRGPR